MKTRHWISLAIILLTGEKIGTFMMACIDLNCHRRIAMAPANILLETHTHTNPTHNQDTLEDTESVWLFFSLTKTS